MPKANSGLSYALLSNVIVGGNCMSDERVIQQADLTKIANNLGVIHDDLGTIDSKVGTVNDNVKVVYDEIGS